jgi:hypothetical protein
MKRILILIAVLMASAIPTAARADVAPPAQPPGSSLLPGSETTQVRMLAETVVIDVQPTASGKSLGSAHVTADFTMHNMSGMAESMAARFPIAASDGFFNVNEIHDLRIKVDRKPVVTHRIMGEDPYRGSQQVPWAAFDVTFPAGQDLPIQVEYTLEAAGEYPYVWFKYILSSGAGWKDTIGSADIIVRLPYEATTENLLLDTSEILFGTTKGGVLHGNEIGWHYTDLEPTAQDNFEVNLVMPSAWERLLAEERNLDRNPADGESWGRLGKLCKEMAYSSRGKGFRSGNTFDPGAAMLYQQGLDAYDTAVTLLPRDALWHAGYADLLTYHAYFDAFNGMDTTQEAMHGMREIQLALALAPNDSKVQQIAEQIAGSFPDGMRRNGDAYDYPWLTATPSPGLPTLPATPEVVEVLPTATITPQVATPTPQAPPAGGSKPALPVCGSALVLPLLLAGIAFSKRHSDRLVTCPGPCGGENLGQ